MHGLCLWRKTFFVLVKSPFSTIFEIFWWVFCYRSCLSFFLFLENPDSLEFHFNRFCWIFFLEKRSKKRGFSKKKSFFVLRGKKREWKKAYFACFFFLFSVMIIKVRLFHIQSELNGWKKRQRRFFCVAPSLLGLLFLRVKAPVE